MIIQIENTQSNRDLIEAFNGQVEKLEQLSKVRDVVLSDIYDEKDQIGRFKKFKRDSQIKKTEIQNGLSGLRKQMGEVQSRLENASIEEQEDLKSQMANLISDYQALKNKETRLDSALNNYDVWMEFVSNKKIGNSEKLEKINAEMRGISKNIIAISKVLQGRTKTDFYSEFIISTLFSSSDKKENLVLTETFKLQIESVNQISEQSEN